MATTLEARAAAASQPAIAVLRSGHRMFFLGAAVWAVMSLGLWIAALAGWLRLSAAWHGHELLWGFAAAAIAGFLTAAVPKWTNSGLFSGAPVLALFALWLAGRAAVALDAWPWVDIAFLPVMAAAVFRRLWRARNTRNFQVAALLLLLAVCNGLWHYGAPTEASRAAVLLVVALIALIGGRIIPGFTRNAVVGAGGDGSSISSDERVEPLVVPALVAAALAELVAPRQPWTGAYDVAVAGLLAWRARSWGLRSTLRMPIVVVLHLAWWFAPLGLLLWGLSALNPWIGMNVPHMAGLHALTAGAIGGMILAVASRAARGHAGVPLRASGWTNLAYVLILAGACLRIVSAWGGQGWLVQTAGLAWAAGWLVFAVEHAPMLLRPRRDGLPG